MIIMAANKMTMLANVGDDPKKKRPMPLNENQLKQFGVFGGSPDVHQQALYLVKKGMVGAGQIVGDRPNLSTREGIVNSQADWKPAAISAMLVRARQLGLQTPNEIAANKDVVMGALDPRIKSAITHPEFQNIHPNFWQTFNSVLSDQYANEAKQLQPLTLLAKK